MPLQRLFDHIDGRHSVNFFIFEYVTIATSTRQNVKFPLKISFFTTHIKSKTFQTKLFTPRLISGVLLTQIRFRKIL